VKNGKKNKKIKTSSSVVDRSKTFLNAHAKTVVKNQNKRSFLKSPTQEMRRKSKPRDGSFKEKSSLL
jgi:hypothetical protein